MSKKKNLAARALLKGGIATLKLFLSDADRTAHVFESEPDLARKDTHMRAQMRLMLQYMQNEQDRLKGRPPRWPDAENDLNATLGPE